MTFRDLFNKLFKLKLKQKPKLISLDEAIEMEEARNPGAKERIDTTYEQRQKPQFKKDRELLMIFGLQSQHEKSSRYSTHHSFQDIEDILEAAEREVIRDVLTWLWDNHDHLPVPGEPPFILSLDLDNYLRDKYQVKHEEGDRDEAYANQPTKNGGNDGV